MITTGITGEFNRLAQPTFNHHFYILAVAILLFVLFSFWDYSHNVILFTLVGGVGLLQVCWSLFTIIKNKRWMAKHRKELLLELYFGDKKDPLPMFPACNVEDLSMFDVDFIYKVMLETFKCDSKKELTAAEIELVKESIIDYVLQEISLRSSPTFRGYYLYVYNNRADIEAIAGLPNLHVPLR